MPKVPKLKTYIQASEIHHGKAQYSIAPTLQYSIFKLNHEGHPKLNKRTHLTGLAKKENKMHDTVDS